MKMLALRDTERYPSTCDPSGKFIVLEIEVFSGAARIKHTCIFRSDAEEFTDRRNRRRKDTTDPFCIAYDSRGNIVRDFVIVSSHPKQHPGLAL